MHVVHLEWQDQHTIDQLEHVLRQGKIIAGSSDTVIGLFAMLTEAGFLALNAAKQRSDKPYLMLLAGKQHVARYAQTPLSPPVKQLVDHCWPGPLTLIVRAKSTLPSFLIAPDGTIALRVPAHKRLLELLARVDGLFSTSANLTGQPIPDTIQALDEIVLAHVGAVVSETAPTRTVPSTILDCTRDTITVARQGAYAIEDLEQIAGQKFVRL